MVDSLLAFLLALTLALVPCRLGSAEAAAVRLPLRTHSVQCGWANETALSTSGTARSALRVACAASRSADDLALVHARIPTVSAAEISLGGGGEGQGGDDEADGLDRRRLLLDSTQAGFLHVDCAAAVYAAGWATTAELPCIRYAQSRGNETEESQRDVFALRACRAFAGGLPFDLECAEAEDVVLLPWENSTGVLLHSKGKDLLVAEPATLPPMLNGTAGCMGMAYAQSDEEMGLMERILDKLLLPRIVGIDFAVHWSLDERDETSSLVLGEYDLSADGRPVHWSERQPFVQPNHHVFPLYHLSVCGVNLFSNYSSYWTAVVDTSATCMYLPAQFYTMISKWTVLRCTSLEDENNLEMCHFATRDGWAQPAAHQDSGAGANETDPWSINHPPISFQMEENGERLFLPLRNLCIYRPRDGGFPVNTYSAYLGENEPIVLGTTVLDALYTVFDYQTRRVGFYNKDSSIAEEDASPEQGACPLEPTCFGSQSYYAPVNECLDPTCDEYYFQAMDQETKRCHLTRTFEIVLLFSLFLFAFAELVIYEVYIKLTSAAVTMVPPFDLSM